MKNLISIGTKIKIKESYYESFVLLAKKGNTAILKSYEEKTTFKSGIPTKENMAIIELSNGNVTHIPIKLIEVYVPAKRETLSSMSNETLVSRFEILVAHETHMKMGTKAHKKQLQDIKRYREEILMRL